VTGGEGANRFAHEACAPLPPDTLSRYAGGANTLCGLPQATFKYISRAHRAYVKPNITTMRSAAWTHRARTDEALPRSRRSRVRARTSVRLIDSRGGHQQMTSATDRIVVSTPARFFNYIELFESSARRFSPEDEADTEDVLSPYQACGHRVSEEAERHVAIALWDRKKRRLVIVRDAWA